MSAKSQPGEPGQSVARRSAVFFVSDTNSAAEEAAGAMADHLPHDGMLPELASAIECAITEFFMKLPEAER